MYGAKQTRSLTENEINALKEPKKSKKTVFANAMLCHVWANQSQESGRNSSGRLYFEGTDIFSYGSHYLAARIFTNKDGTQYALLNSYRYSMQTVMQLNDIEAALRGKMPYYTVPNTKMFNCPENIAYVESRVLESIADIYNYRKKTWRNSAKDILSNIKENISETNLTLKAMGAPLMVLTDAQEQAITEVLKSKLALKAAIVADPNRLEKNKKAWLRKNQDRIDFHNNFKGTTLNEAIEQFRNFEINSFNGVNTVPYKIRFNYKERMKLQEFNIKITELSSPSIGLDYDILRVNVDKNIVETSNGANVPLDHAIRAFKLIKAGKDKAIKLGHFEVDSVSNGIVKIGCHEVELSEAESVLAPFMTNLTLVE